MCAIRGRLLVALLVLIGVSGCAPNPSGSSSPTAGASARPSPAASAVAPEAGSLVIVGKIVTMDEPAVAEAVLIDGGDVAAIGTRDEVLALAGNAPLIDIGENVAYPGFIDAHAHWIGDREYYDVDSAEAAIEPAVSRGWTSISEQWVNPERLDELTRLAADDALPLRVDAYLALNYDTEFFGDWYTSRVPGPVDDRLRVQGLKIHLDDGWGDKINWDPEDLTATIARANDAGWQVSVHAMSPTAQGIVLDAFEAALGANGPNPLHHRVEHALVVTDDQLARLVAMDIATVIHLDGAADWLVDARNVPAIDRTKAGEHLGWVARWREFVDAGLHVASATDAPWTFPDLKLTDQMGRPVDQIAAGMDGFERTTQATPAFLRNQLLTADQALQTVTRDAAWALGDDTRRGHLAPGTAGDVTVLSGDVTAATPDEIRAMTVVATIVAGVPAYCAGPEVCSR